MVADAIVRANRARSASRQIEYVMLEACSQGNMRGLFSGETNAQAFQRALRAELAARNYQLANDVSVVAADRPGVLYNDSTQRVGPPWARRFDPVRYVPADAQKPGIYFGDPRWEPIYLAIGTAAAGSGTAYLLLRIEKDRRKKSTGTVQGR
jgi:hypothetical protein